MRLDVSQQMKMDQRMALAPRMIQSMEILQLPLLALQERIEHEMLSNPMLEMEEPTSENPTERTPQDQRQNDKPESEQSLVIREDANKQDDFNRLESIGDTYDDYLSRSSYVQARRASDEPDRKLEAMQNTAAPAESLNEYLHQQWRFIEAEPIIKQAGSAIIDYINEAGYLSVTLESIEEHIRQPVTLEQMREALRLVQTLDPTGVGARDLPECLLIQLQGNNEECQLEMELIAHHLHDLQMNRFPQVARKTGHTIEEIKHAIKNISRLDLRPGLQIGRGDTRYIMPDIIVDFDEENDRYEAKLTDGSVPNLRLNTDYQQMLKQKKLTGETKEFLQNNVRSARWLMEAIQQRKATVLRVVNHVLKTQRDFLDHGQLHLKPLPMVDVADKLGIHVGTVSRAVSGKYMQTPTGIFALRSFFTGGTENSAGESVSWDAVKAKLQEVIDGEDKKKPYNDDQLVEQLTKNGLTVARRTVAKYRGLMNIPPARRRKQFD